LNEGLRTPQSLREDFIVAGFLLEQGSLLLRLGRLEEAEMRLQQASDRFRRLGNVFHYANALASLCELYYSRGSEGDLDKMSRTAESARSIDNGLIDYHLARIELAVGRAWVDSGELSNAVDAFCTASERALNFNDESFIEVCEEVVSEIDRIVQKVTPAAALPLCDSYIAFWNNRALSLEKKELVKRWLEKIRQKQDEIRALMPVS
jgi:tetratricopeptide (TPR) repeat protein